MKKLQILLPLAAVLLGLTGCKKDNEKSGPSGETVTFTANIGGGEKTEIYDGTKMKWSYGDKITINGDEFTSDFPMGDYTTANFVGHFTTPPSDYCAYYPDTLYKGGKYVLPATQRYNGSTLSGINPMYAYQPNVDNKTLQFHNICALVKLQVTGTGTVRTIVVTSDNPLCGEFEPKTDDNVHYYAKVAESGSKTLTLNCGAGVDLNVTIPTTFYIALPQGDLGNLTFKIGGYTSDPVPANLEAGKLYTKTLEDVEVPVIEFSVSATQKVKFAPGNLWYDGSAFHFETNQWGFEDSWNSSHVSHFQWSPDKDVAVGTSTSVSGTPDDVFFTNETETTANPDFQVSGETAGTWRTLSNGEWSYLLNTSGSSSSGRTDVNRFAKARVNGVRGMLIFPDGYTLPEGYTTAAGGTGMAKVNNTGASWPTKDIPTEKWTLMESSGAVFLPAAGFRDGTDVGNVGSYSYYWSSTPDEVDEDYAYRMYFYSSGVYTNNDYRGSGLAVRLVR